MRGDIRAEGPAREIPAVCSLLSSLLVPFPPSSVIASAIATTRVDLDSGIDASAMIDINTGEMTVLETLDASLTGPLVMHEASHRWMYSTHVRCPDDHPYAPGQLACDDAETGAYSWMATAATLMWADFRLGHIEGSEDVVSASMAYNRWLNICMLSEHRLLP